MTGRRRGIRKIGFAPVNRNARLAAAVGLIFHSHNTLYNQLELGVQVADRTQLVRLAVPPTEVASLLRGLMRHRYELSQEAAQRKNKLIAICDEIFPEFTLICKNPCSPSALSIGKQFPTPQALAVASTSTLQAVRGYNRQTQ